MYKMAARLEIRDLVAGPLMSLPSAPSIWRGRWEPRTAPKPPCGPASPGQRWNRAEQALLSGFLIQNMQGQAKNQNLKKKNFFLKVFRCFLYAARFGDHSHKSNWVLKLHLSIKMQIPRCPALGGALTSEFSQVPQVILIQLGLQLSSSLWMFWNPQTVPYPDIKPLWACS